MTDETITNEPRTVEDIKPAPVKSKLPYIYPIAVLAMIVYAVGSSIIESVPDLSTLVPKNEVTTTEAPVTESPVVAEAPAPVEEPAPTVEPPVVVNDEDNSLTSIREMRRFYLAANRVDGKIVIRTEGSSSWRYNNPAKLIISDFTRMMGSLGSDGEHAVFPSYEAGRKAAYAYLFTEANNLKNGTVKQVFKDYALEEILKVDGVKPDTVLGTLTDEQKEKVLDAIQVAEEFKSGKETVFENEDDFRKRGW